MIHLSKAAAREVGRLKSKHRNLNGFFRLGVQPTGCCGLSYTMAFEDNVNSEDRVYESEGMQVAIASEHLKYLHNLSLDYSEDLMGGGFRFNNPNASQCCSCGHSFSLRE